MQQVRFKDHSMEAARHSNDRDYYLFDIHSEYAVLKYIDGNVWRSLTVNLVALEVATPLCVLPVVYDDTAMCDRLAALIQLVFDNETNFMHNFSIDGSLINSGVDCFYMASGRCFIRYECGDFECCTTIRTADFLDWVAGLDL